VRSLAVSFGVERLAAICEVRAGKSRMLSGSTLATQLVQLLQVSTYSDIKFNVEGVLIPAHKVRNPELAVFRSLTSPLLGCAGSEIGILQGSVDE